jgi:hypothetical protein
LTTDLTPEDLAALDREATQGRWIADNRSIIDPAGHWFASFDGEASAAFIVALVNAYRAGKLVHVDTLRIQPPLGTSDFRYVSGSVDAKGDRHE